MPSAALAQACTCSDPTDVDMPYVCLADSTDPDGDRKKLSGFNRNRPQAERVSMDDLRDDTVTKNLQRAASTCAEK